VKIVRVTAIVAVLASLTACGVPTQQSARKVEARDVPFGLLDNNSGSPISDRLGEAVIVYFAKDERLVASSRGIGAPVTLDRVIDALRKGPSKPETAAGLRTALPEAGTFKTVTLAQGTARVDLGSPFTALSSTDQILGLAQLVYTLTGRPGIGLVRFTLEGANTEVLRANGSLTSDRVSRDDYVSLAPAA
jgi:spore germination protein GerM